MLFRSLPPRASSQDGRTRYLPPTMDLGGPQTVEIHRPLGGAPHPPVRQPLASPPTAQPTMVHPPIAQPTIAEPTIAQPTIAEPTIAQPTAGQSTMGHGRAVEPPSGTTPEAAPVNPASTTDRESGRIWGGWVLALVAVAVAVAGAYAVYGLAPLFITTTVPLVVAETGAGVLLLALLIAVGRRRQRLAIERARREAQQEAWAHHQQFR